MNNLNQYINIIERSSVGTEYLKYNEKIQTQYEPLQLKHCFRHKNTIPLDTLRFSTKIRVKPPKIKSILSNTKR